MSYGYKPWNEDSQLPVLSTRTQSLAIEIQCHSLGHHVNADSENLIGLGSFCKTVKIYFWPFSVILDLLPLDFFATIKRALNAAWKL